MQDIAERCGVSRATVSFAMRDDPRISMERRRQIQETARELGYSPNPLLNSLMQQMRHGEIRKHGNLTVFMCNHVDTAVFMGKNPFYTQIYNACRDQAQEMGYAMDLLEAGRPGTTTAQINRVLKARSARGIIIPPSPPGFKVPDLDFSLLSVVKIGYVDKELKCHRIVPYHAQAMRHTLRILKERGYKRLAFIFQDSVDQYSNFDFLTYASRYNYEAGKRAIPFLVVNDTTPSRQAKEYVARNKPDIVVADSRPTYLLLKEAGLNFPEDVEFCCLNTIHVAEESAGFRQNMELLGRETVKFLDNLIHHNRRGLPEHPLTLKVGGEWVDGPTMRPVNTAKTMIKG